MLSYRWLIVHYQNRYWPWVIGYFRVVLDTQTFRPIRTEWRTLCKTILSFCPSDSDPSRRFDNISERHLLIIRLIDQQAFQYFPSTCPSGSVHSCRAFIVHCRPGALTNPRVFSCTIILRLFSICVRLREYLVALSGKTGLCIQQCHPSFPLAVASSCAILCL